MQSEPQRRGAKVVDAILEATIKELGRVGFAGLSVEEVAVRAGVNKTTIYRRWPTKSELVRAALMAGAAGSGTLPDTGDVRSDLVEYMRGVRDRLSTAEGRSIFVALLADEPSITALADELSKHGGAGMRKILRRAIERGELGRDVDTDLVAELIFGAVQVRLLFRRDASIGDAYLEKAIAIAIAGANATEAAGASPRPAKDEPAKRARRR